MRLISSQRIAGIFDLQCSTVNVESNCEQVVLSWCNGKQTCTRAASRELAIATERRKGEHFWDGILEDSPELILTIHSDNKCYDENSL